MFTPDSIDLSSLVSAQYIYFYNVGWDEYGLGANLNSIELSSLERLDSLDLYGTAFTSSTFVLNVLLQLVFLVIVTMLYICKI